MTKHLAIFKPETAELILSGQKTIETRFSLHKIVPFGQISTGDLVFVKISGKDIKGQFRVKKVINFQGLEPKDIEEIFKRYKKEILAGDNYYTSKRSANYASIIFIEQSERLITSPIRYKKRDRRGWVVLD